MEVFLLSEIVSGCSAAMLVAQGDLEGIPMSRWHSLCVPSLMLGRTKHGGFTSYERSRSMDAAISPQLPYLLRDNAAFEIEVGLSSAWYFVRRHHNTPIPWHSSTIIIIINTSSRLCPHCLLQVWYQPSRFGWIRNQDHVG